MEIAEFVPLAQKNKRSARSRKKALALKEETKSKEGAKRASKERGNLFGQISRQTGLSIEEVNYCFCLIILNSYVWVSFCRAGILAVSCPFLAVQDSSIGDLVTHSLTHSLTHLLILASDTFERL